MSELEIPQAVIYIPSNIVASIDNGNLNRRLAISIHKRCIENMTRVFCPRKFKVELIKGILLYLFRRKLICKTMYVPPKADRKAKSIFPSVLFAMTSISIFSIIPTV